MAISLNQQIEEVERELEMRVKVYPRIKGSQAVKDYQVQRMQAVLATLQWLKKHEPRIRYAIETEQEAKSEKPANEWRDHEPWGDKDRNDGV